jgi:NADP-dependent 3-hydroxy acid dehydrogenase YdfG
LQTATETLRQEAGAYLRVTEVSPGFVDTDFAESISDSDVQATIVARKKEFAITPDAIARAVAFAIEQPADVEISSIVVRPTARD